jgi:hypothetical protein
VAGEWVETEEGAELRVWVRGVRLTVAACVRLLDGSYETAVHVGGETIVDEDADLDHETLVAAKAWAETVVREAGRAMIDAGLGVRDGR